MQGVAREAWMEIGIKGSRRGDISHSNRELDILGSIACATDMISEQCMHRQFVVPACEKLCDGIFISPITIAHQLFCVLAGFMANSSLWLDI